MEFDFTHNLKKLEVKDMNKHLISDATSSQFWLPTLKNLASANKERTTAVLNNLRLYSRDARSEIFELANGMLENICNKNNNNFGELDKNNNYNSSEDFADILGKKFASDFRLLSSQQRLFVERIVDKVMGYAKLEKFTEYSVLQFEKDLNNNHLVDSQSANDSESNEGSGEEMVIKCEPFLLENVEIEDEASRTHENVIKSETEDECGSEDTQESIRDDGCSIKESEKLLRQCPQQPVVPRKHACDFCEKSFNQRWSLTSHIDTFHKGIRKHVCNVCGKSFNQKVHLLSHAATHERTRKFVCPVCSKSFLVERYLDRHMDVHKEVRVRHTCDICYKSFSFKSGLSKHKLVHAEMKTFICNVCCKVFTQQDSLKRHMSRHKETRPYECCVCGKFFSQEAHLNKHYTAVHDGISQVN